jgi:hypothetical protein
MLQLHHSPGRPLFPTSWDSTMLAAFRSCPHKAFRQYIQHHKPRGQSVHLVAGGAFAKGVEVARISFYEGGRNSEDSVAAGIAALVSAYGDFQCPPDSAKSLARTLGALEFYFSQYPLGADGMEPVTFANGRRGIEFSFAEPLPVLHPVTGDPILYTGRTDMIAKFAGGVYVVDEKTTTALGASWAKQWDLRSQFTGYIWACQQAGVPAGGAIVRGVSILKTKYDTLQVPTYRSPFEIERWLHQVCRDIERAKAMWEEGYWDQSLDSGCQEYGGCSFQPVCRSAEPEKWLEVGFQRIVWSPLDRKELSVEEWELEHAEAMLTEAQADLFTLS